MEKHLSTIANPKTNQKTLVKAIQQLGPVTEPVSFWTAIANNTEYSQEHRRWAVWELFHRHVKPGITLADLARILGNPIWLADESISVVTVLRGKIPVKLTFEDTVFLLLLFPDIPDDTYDSWGIYLRVSGKVDREGLIKIIRGQPVPEETRHARVLEYGLVPADPLRMA